MKLITAIKFGFGFYIGYELAKTIYKVLGETYILLKEKDKENE